MNEEVARVAIVDDQVLYREGLRGLIEHWPEFSVVCEASNGKEAIELCRRTVPDLVLMDVQMPVMDGIEAAKIIHREFPQMAIVMLTVVMSDDYVFDALRTGIRGYMLKDTPARQLRNRLQGVLQGDATLSDAVTARVLDEFNRLRSASNAKPQEVPLGAEHLSAREIEVLRLVAHGMSNEEIGTQLYLSVGTVKKQLAVLMQKLNLENRVQVAVYAVRSGLIDEE
ncbi:MAG: response regulator transcription factor [Actinobacteria bacterium]|nr:response regulator transcription factor [Actinomycetota bacterium]